MSLKSKVAISTVLFIFLITGVNNPLFAQIKTSREYDLKAYFIYTFTRFVEWRDFEKDSNFVIGIIGNSKLISPLEKIANSKLVKNKKITIKKWSQFEDIDKCHILFITELKKDKLDKIIKKTEGKSILTISDTKGFAQKGVCINFIVVSDKIRFEINRKATEINGLTVSSQLLNLAILVD